MKPVLGCDAHKRYSVFVSLFEDGKTGAPVRVEHQRESFRQYLKSLAEQSEIAIESTGHWYWLVDEIEQAGHRPHLAQPFEAKKRMGRSHKTDPLDAKGLAILLRNGTLPEVWIPPGALRDQRELLRTRMALRDLRTMLKHRIHSALERYGIFHTGVGDLFGVKGREFLDSISAPLPPYTTEMLREQLKTFDEIGPHVTAIEKRIREVLHPDPMVKRLQTMPGVGEILGPVIALEIGDISRFGRAEQLASYCGLVPRVFSSGGKTHHGRTSRFVNLYLKWAFVEAAVCAARLQGARYRHVRHLYQKLKPKGHGRAVVAIGRHLAEAAFWMLSRQRDYQPPQPVRSAAAATVDLCRSSSPPSSTSGSARDTSDIR
jgi:transposase